MDVHALMFSGFLVLDYIPGRWSLQQRGRDGERPDHPGGHHGHPPHGGDPQGPLLGRWRSFPAGEVPGFGYHAE